ncbi:MAG TPA: PCRF domain-containing protein, partial [Patescibacteria group bacterium]|nr:PCRF domain-containing protein [Patescibacteria group bacterium]
MNSKKNVQELEKKIQELESKLKDPSVYNTPEKLKQVSQEYNQAKDKLRNIEGMKELEKRIKSTKGMIENEEDPDMIKMAEKELEQLQ